MRILSIGSMYPPHHLGGAELIWRSAVLHARARGHEVRVLTTDHRVEEPDPAIAEDADAHRELRWYWRDYSFPRYSFLEHLAIERHNRYVLDRHLEGFGPDVVVWWSMGGMSLSLLERARRREVAAVGVLLDDWLVYGPAVDGWQRMWRRLGPLRRLAGLFGAPPRVDLSAAAVWVFMSETVKAHAREAGVAVEGCPVVYRGIDRDLFEPGPPGRPWRGRLLYVGRVEPRKGVEVAVRSLEHLPAARLELIGPFAPGYNARLEQIASECGVAERLSFRGVPCDRLGTEMAGADAVLFPVLWEEPWGLVPLEAMACGTPVVATGAGGSGEYLRDGVNCLLYDPREDPRALADAVARLERPELREKLRKGGLETASSFDVTEFDAAVLDAAVAATTATRAPGR